MKRFNLSKLVSLFGSLHQVQTVCGHVTATGQEFNSDYSWYVRICRDAAVFLNEIGFDHSSRKAFNLKIRFESRLQALHAAAIQAEFRSLEDSVLLDMTQHKFAQINQRVAKFAESKDLMGAKVSEHFPNAVVDITEAGNCIALGCDTAAVFHLMHVVEWGLRGFASHLGLLKVSVGRKHKPVPMEYAQWEQILNQLPDKIEERLAKLSRGPKKQQAQEFYYPVLKDIGGFKDAWRNHLMHTRSRYTSEDALAVLSHVERFMQSLADHDIKESGKKTT